MLTSSAESSNLKTPASRSRKVHDALVDPKSGRRFVSITRLDIWYPQQAVSSPDHALTCLTTSQVPQQVPNHLAQVIFDALATKGTSLRAKL